MCVSSYDGTRMSKENHVLAVVLIGQLMQGMPLPAIQITEKEDLDSEKGVVQFNLDS